MPGGSDDRQFKSADCDYASTVALVRNTAAELVGEDLRGQALRSLAPYREGLRRHRASAPALRHVWHHPQRWLQGRWWPSRSALREERDYYRRFQFQAMTEENADDLMDIRA
jgi:hypothetical protein